MKRAIVLHGTMGQPEGNWFPWLARQLEVGGMRVDVPRLPTPDGQCLQAWMRIVENLQPDKETLLVGHSCGATCALRALEIFPVAEAMLVSLVAGPLGVEPYDTLNASFVEGGFDWDAIRSHTPRVHVLHGDDDPYVPVAQARMVADGLGIAPVLISGGRHLNAEAGYVEFPQLLEVMDGR